MAQAVLGEKELVTAKRVLELEELSYQKQICIPSELAARKAELEASANHAWVKVRCLIVSLSESTPFIPIIPSDTSFSIFTHHHSAGAIAAATTACHTTGASK